MKISIRKFDVTLSLKASKSQLLEMNREIYKDFITVPKLQYFHDEFTSTKYQIE